MAFISKLLKSLDLLKAFFLMFAPFIFIGMVFLFIEILDIGEAEPEIDCNDYELITHIIFSEVELGEYISESVIPVNWLFYEKLTMRAKGKDVYIYRPLFINRGDSPDYILVSSRDGLIVKLMAKWMDNSEEYSEVSKRLISILGKHVSLYWGNDSLYFSNHKIECNNVKIFIKYVMFGTEETLSVSLTDDLR